ncbi:MAG: hypothetical protein ACK2U2_23560 [Anaerolineae bacterium]
MRRSKRPRRLETSVDIPFAAGMSHLPPNQRPHLLRWLRRLRPGPLPSCLPTRPCPLPSCLPTRPCHPHRTFYQLDPTTGTWEQL